jgi:TolB protein
MKTLPFIFTIILTALVISCEPIEFSTSEADSKIIFISRRTDNSPSWSLYSMNSNGSDQNKITDLLVTYGKPVISNSGKTVLFVTRNPSQYSKLYSVNIDGSNLRLIDSASRYCGFADWSSDDSKIIYSKNRNTSTDEKDLVIHDFITGNKTTLTQSGNNFSAVFSPDKKIAFCQQTDEATNLFLMNIDGTNKKLIAAGSSPVWSPDGEKIAYVGRGTSGSPQVFVSNADGGDIMQLTTAYLWSWDSGFAPFGNYYPKWTPDGKKIVYQSDINNRGQSEIYIMNTDGTNQTRLTHADKRSESPEITSDGRYILFSSNCDLNFGTEIYVMDIDGANQHSLSKYAGDDCLPVLSRK